MSATLAMAPSPAPHDRPSFSEMASSATTAAPAGSKTAPPPPPAPTAASSSPSAQRTGAAPPAANGHGASATRSGSSSPRNAGLAPRSSPNSALGAAPPKIVVKKEPGSPSLTNTRPRPRRLDLSKNTNSSSNSPGAQRPLTARDGMGIQEMGIACLSPGFVTDNPQMKGQIQRSMSVREQQRHIIESRLHQQSAKGDGPLDKEPGSAFAAKTPGMSRRNKAPPGLSIVAPSHEQFANERVIQSAPLGHSFTGRQQAAPMSRHFAGSNLSSTSHIHHVPAAQTSNRLPPISDVFGQGLSAHPENPGYSAWPSHEGAKQPASPAHPPPPPGPLSARPREYKSAEEAQHELSGGRPELLPKIVHYGGHQPPTPPSPAPGSRHAENSRSASKRRTRAEYEEGASPPLGYGPAPRRGPFGAGRDSPDTQKAKRDEFLRLCERAWDLFHS